MVSFNITAHAAPTGVAYDAKPKAVRGRCDVVIHPDFVALAMDRYNSLSDADADTNIQETVIATGRRGRKLVDDADLTRGTQYWYRMYWIDRFGNQSLKSTAVAVTYRGSASGDIEDDAVTDAKVDATAPGTPTGLTLTQVARNTDGGDGRIEVAIRATWTAPASGVPVKRYKLEITDGTDTWYEYTKQSSCKFPAVVGKTYTVKVNAESINAEGAQTSGVALAPVAKSTAPGSPTSVSIVARAGQNKVKFTMPSDKDIAGANIYFNSTNDAGAATKIAGEVKTDDYIDATARAAGTACYYWVATVNRSDVEGTKVAASNNPQSARAIVSADITPLNITQTEVAPMAILPSKLFPREFTNLFSDPELVEVGNYTLTAGTGAITRVANDSNWPLGPSRFLLCVPAANELTKEITAPIDVPVEAAQSYVISAVVGGTAFAILDDTQPFIPTLYADFYRVDAVGSPTTLISTVTIEGPSGVLPYTLQNIVTAPANAQVMRLRFKKSRTADGTANALYVGSPTVRRQTRPAEVLNGVIQKGAFQYVGGLTLSNGDSDPANDIDVAAGRCCDMTLSSYGDIELTFMTTKRLDALWGYSAGAGGRDTGSISNGTWHVWAIKNPTSNLVDVLFSLSATSPTMPSGYTQKCRIGSFIRSGGVILPFKQFGNEFLLDSPVLDVDVTDQGTSAVSRTLTVPMGIQVEALVRAVANNATVYNVLLSALDVANAAPAVGAAPLATLGGPAGVASRAEARIRTDTSGRIRSRSSQADTTLRIATYGWIDNRGAA